MSSTIWAGKADGDMPAPEDADAGHGVVEVLGSESITWLLKPGDAATTAVSYRIWLKPEPVRVGGEALWFTDHTEKSGLQDDVTFPGDNSTGGRAVTVKKPPGVRAYLQLHTLTGATKSVHIAVVRR